MTTLAVVGAQIAGNALVQTATAVAVTTASGYISRAFDNRNFQGPRLESFHLQTSRDGAPMPRVFGRVRLAGQVIWASHVRETSTEESVGGGKGGGPTQTNYNYTISFAIGLCEGEILGVDRIWVNGAPLSTRGLTIRTYRGTEDQLPDPIIAATELGTVPAFRGTAYIVFEGFPIDDYGARLPQINVEIVRAAKGADDTPRLESLIKSVCLLPGSGEFAYETNIIEESPRPGQTLPINMNNLTGRADIDVALDQLEAQLPYCKNVSIISAWFGTSVNCGDCLIYPGVERREKVTRGAQWQVGRDDRGSAYIISTDNDGRPNFGGTPSDESLIAAIRALKRRGFTVTLYPFLMMDTAGFPWRGRVTSTVDRTALTRVQIESYFGVAQPSDYSLGTGENHYRATDQRYRNFILSHANLARRAGGVDTFIVGSEMKALTTLRDANDAFPAVEAFIDLAVDVKAMLGASTAVTYAADWSEYFGYHPQDGSGDIYFHLDPLWANPAISGIGIDAYFPLSDWRDGAHLDADISSDIYDPTYLESQVEGGEGYDWYYANTSDRDAQIRTPITDWVYRYKDLRSWWRNPHFDRVNGVETQTQWVPQSKPFLLTEVGCPAVRFGANQPNLFTDGKSTESNIPYYSDGSRDDLIQRRYLEAIIGYWAKDKNNPVSDVDGRRMVDTTATSVWAWDARPFPDFPARLDVWSDGLNWQAGHWITGRMGLVSLSDVLDEICADAGFSDVDTTRVSGLVSGYVIDQPMRARDAISPLLQSYDVTLSEDAGQLRFFSAMSEPLRVITASDIAFQDGGSIEMRLDDNIGQIRDARVTFIDASRDYQFATISARNLLAETVQIADLRLPIFMDPGQARLIAERTIAQSDPQRQSANFSVTRTVGDMLYAGARISLHNVEGMWQVQSLNTGLQTNVSAVRLSDVKSSQTVTGVDPVRISEPAWVSEPVAAIFEFPGTTGPFVGALMQPFRPAIFTALGQTKSTDRALRIGALLSDLPIGPIVTPDFGNSFEFWLPDTALSARDLEDVKNGANRFAIETLLGWEILGAADIAMTGPQTWRAETLLRGLDNSDDAMVTTLAAGARIVWLNEGLTSFEIDNEYVGQTINVDVTAAGRDGASTSLIYKAAHLQPLSPVRVQVTETEGIITLQWTPRRVDGVDDLDPNARFEVAWEDQVLETSETSIVLPIASGDDRVVTIHQINELGGPSGRVEIIV